jgi:hemin uptake protein HemP
MRGEREEGVDSSTGQVRTVRAETLLRGERILRIEHNGELYTLRLTRNEKLLLTK